MNNVTIKLIFLLTLTVIACHSETDFSIPDINTIKPGSPAELYLPEFNNKILLEKSCKRHCVSPDGSKEIIFDYIDESKKISVRRDNSCPFILWIKDTQTQEAYKVLPLWEHDTCSSVSAPFPIYWANDSKAIYVEGITDRPGSLSGKNRYTKLILLVDEKQLWSIPDSTDK